MINHLDILTKKNISIGEAIVRLKKTGCKCLIIVDEKKKLLGTLTDGDLRDLILKKTELNKSISKFYNKKPKYIQKKEYTLDIAKKLFHKYGIDTIPIVDKKQVVKILTWSDIFLKKSSLSDVSVVIIAGGKGERLIPFTNVMPKPLIPVYDKTIIENIIDQFIDYDISRFQFTLNYKAELIKTYLKSIKKKKIFKFYKENKPLGTAGSLKLLNERELGENFFVTNCDILIKSDFKKIFDYHMQRSSMLTVVTCYQKYKIPYGTCVLTKKGTLKSLVEKPETDHLINTGFYLMNKKILKLIPKNTKLDFNDLIKIALKKKYKICVYPIDLNSWVDVGTWSEYKKNINIFK